MDDPDRVFSDGRALWEDCGDGCAPPLFDLPPPPRPPWLEDLEDCGGAGTGPAHLDTCDTTLIRDHQTLFDDTFHSVAVIVVSAVVLVLVLLVAAVTIFRRQKRLHLQDLACHPARPKDVPALGPRQYLVAEVAAGCHTRPHVPAPSSCDATLRKIAAVTALTRHGHTLTRCCGNLEAHFQRHYAASGPTNSLPNHYIPDLHPAQGPAQHQHQHQHLHPHPHPPRAYTLKELRQKINAPRCPAMALSERPPAVFQSPAYPHILIGGKPFYLIPTGPDEPVGRDGSFESYAYPQHVPIYEEIDGEGAESVGKFYAPPSDPDYSSERGEVGSTERLAFPPATDLRGAPRSPRPPFAAGRPASSQHRSLSSHSRQSSRQTTASDLSSSNSSTSSASNPNLHPHYVQLEPEVDLPPQPPRDRDGRRPRDVGSGRASRVRPSSSLERCRSPQSVLAARLAPGGAPSPAPGPGRSVYYYADTARQDPRRAGATIEEGPEESPAPDDADAPGDPVVRPVATKIVLGEAGRGGATLV